MSNTNELRRLAQAALAGPDGISLNWIKLLQDFQQEASPAVVIELLDRLEADENKLETERMRLAACSVAALGYFDGCTKEYTSASLDDVLNLCKRLEEAEKERDALRAKIEAMEKQKPVAEWVDSTFDQYPYLRWREPYKAIAGAKLYTKFYSLPGAQGEEK